MSSLRERVLDFLGHAMELEKLLALAAEGQGDARRKLSLSEVIIEHWFNGYTLCSCKHEKFDIQMEELAKKYPRVNHYVFEAEQHRAYAEHIADVFEKLADAPAPSLHKEGLLETLFRIPFKEIEGIKWVRQLEVVRELRLCDESKLKPGFVNSAVNSTSVQDGQDVRILPAEDTTLSPLLPSDEWESLSSESRMKLRKWFDLAAKYLQRILDEPTALDKEGEPPTILKRVKLYLDSWAAYPAKELGEQPTAYVHSLLRELYEARGREIRLP